MAELSPNSAVAYACCCGLLPILFGQNVDDFSIILGGNFGYSVLFNREQPVIKHFEACGMQFPHQVVHAALVINVVRGKVGGIGRNQDAPTLPQHSRHTWQPFIQGKVSNGFGKDNKIETGGNKGELECIRLNQVFQAALASAREQLVTDIQPGYASSTPGQITLEFSAAATDGKNFLVLLNKLRDEPPPQHRVA